MRTSHVTCIIISKIIFSHKVYQLKQFTIRERGIKEYFNYLNNMHVLYVKK